MARRRIFLHGPLKKLSSEPIELEASTVLEAVSGLARVLNLRTNAISERLMIKVLGFETAEQLKAVSDTQDLHIVPTLAGGKSAFLQIVIGAVLITAAFFTGGLSLMAGVTLSSVLFGIGLAMVIGGLAQMLFPIKLADRANEPNTYLGAPGNTTRAGERIPLIFGRTKVYGQILSYNVDALSS